MSSNPRIDRNAKIDSSGRLKSSMELLTKRAANMSKPRIGDFVEVPLAEIEVSAQVRSDFEDIKSLAESIKEEGQRSPIEVYYDEDDKLVLLSGERRYRSLQAIKAETARAIVVKPPQDVSDKILRQLSENEEREALTPMDRGRAYSQLKEAGLSQSKIARRVRRNRMVVRRHILLYEAPEAIKDAYREELVTDLHAVELLARVLDAYPDDFESLIETARETGGLGRETLENWMEWRESAEPESAPMGTGEASATSDSSTGASSDGGMTLPELPEDGPQAPDNNVAPMGADSDHEESGAPSSGGALSADQGHVSPDAKASAPAAPEKAKPDEAPQKKADPRPAPASPTDQVLAAHYQQETSEKVSPMDLHIEVTAKLLDGKTKITGSLLTDRVDQDTEWVWIMPTDADAPLRVKARTLKVLSVTA